MQVIASSIPNGSHGLIVLPDGAVYGDDYVLACNLLKVDKSTAEVGQAIGRLNTRSMALIGRKAVELGYTQLMFRRAAGRQATRWARYVETVDGMDIYEIDLREALRIYEGRA